MPAKVKSKLVPHSRWTEDEKKFDRILAGMEHPGQLTRINARLDYAEFRKRFTIEQLDAMWERIK